jgi:hypothetical protein
MKMKTGSSKWGGARPGSGPKLRHADPEIKERHKKFRATDEEWQQFLDLLPKDSREGFELLLGFLMEKSKGKE